MGADAGDFDGDGRIDLAVADVRLRPQQPLPQPRRRRRSRTSRAPAGLAAATFAAHELGRRVPRRRPRRRPRTSSSPTATCSRRSTSTPTSRRATRRRDQIFRNEGGRFRDVSADRGPRARRARSAAGPSRSGTSTTTATPTSSSPRWTRSRRCSRTRSGPAPLGRDRGEAARSQSRSRSGRGSSVEDAGRPQAGPRGPLGRRLPVAERPACAVRARVDGERPSPSRCSCSRGAGGSPASPSTVTRRSRWTRRTLSGRSSRGGALPLRRASAPGVALAVLVLAPLAGPAAGRRGRPRRSRPRRPGQPYRYRPKLAVPETMQALPRRAAPWQRHVPGRACRGRADRAAHGAAARPAGGPRPRSRRRGRSCSHPRSAARGWARWRRMRSPPVPACRCSAPAGCRPSRSSTPRRSPASCAGCSRTSAASPSPSSCSPRSTSTASDGLATTDVRYDLVGAGPGRVARRATRASGACAGAGTPRAWRVVEWTAVERTFGAAPRRPSSPRSPTAAFGGNDSFRRQLARRLRRLGRHARLELRPRLERPPRRVGRRRRRRRARRRLRRAAARAAEPALPRPRRRHLRGRHGAAGVGILEDTQQALFADVDNDGDQDLIVVDQLRAAAVPERREGRFTRDPGAFRFEKGLQGAPMSMAIADYDRDGFLDLYLCVYSYYYGAGEAKAGTPDAVPRRRRTARRTCCSGTTATAASWRSRARPASTRTTTASASPPRGADYDGDGWPDLVVANDFGRKNLYHNLGRRDGQGDVRGRGRAGRGRGPRGRDERPLVRLRRRRPPRHLRRPDVERQRPAGDGQRRLHARGARPTSARSTAATPAATRSSATAATARFEDVSLPARANMGRWTWSTDALDFDSDGWEDLYVVNGMVTREASQRGPGLVLLGRRRGALAADAGDRHALRRRLAGHEPAHGRAARSPATSATCSCATTATGGFDDVSGARRARPRPGRPVVRRARLRRRRRPGPRRCSPPAPRRSCGSSATTSAARGATLAVRLAGDHRATATRSARA